MKVKRSSPPAEPVTLGGPSSSRSGTDDIELEDASSKDGSEQPPPHAVNVAETWNSSRSNFYKTMATFFSFIVLGANDAVYGVIIYSLERYYNISYTIVSLVFLSPFVGYIFAALTNNYVHNHFGQRGVAFLGPGAHLVSYAIIVAHPPYPVLVVAFIIAGFGNGVLDAAWNAWVGNMANANQVLGFLHGFYGVGAVLSPAIATAMIARGGLPWWYFYFIMIGGAGLELITAVLAFWKETGAVYQATKARSSGGAGGGLREALKKRVTWVTAIFLLVYVGIEVALGGWIVVFMIRVRDGGEFESGMTATGFWLGITLGRVVLGFLTPYLGEMFAIALYLGIAVVLQLLFWLVPSFLLSAITVAIIGFVLGPMFPTGVVAATKLLPQSLHVSAIGFGAAFGGGGACILPFATGAIAQVVGVQALQPLVLGFLALELIIWVFAMPSIPVDDKSVGAKISGFARKVARRASRRAVAA